MGIRIRAKGENNPVSQIHVASQPANQPAALGQDEESHGINWEEWKFNRHACMMKANHAASHPPAREPATQSLKDKRKTRKERKQERQEGVKRSRDEERKRMWARRNRDDELKRGR